MDILIDLPLLHNLHNGKNCSNDFIQDFSTNNISKHRQASTKVINIREHQQQIAEQRQNEQFVVLSILFMVFKQQLLTNKIENNFHCMSYPKVLN